MFLRLAGLCSALLAFAVLGLALASPVHAQREDLFRRPDSPCRDNPNSEACICEDAHMRARQPRAEHWNTSVNPPRLSTTPVPASVDSFVIPGTGERLSPADIFVTREPDGVWHEIYPPGFTKTVAGSVVNVGREVVPFGDPRLVSEPNLHIPKNFVKKACAHDYFEENLNRLWYFAVALGAALLTVSIAWAGVIHMQESATGQRNTAVRQTLARVVLGILLLSLAYIIWRAVNQEIWGRYIDAGSIALHLAPALGL